ncbi:S41 family peptidase, partial [Flexithrix dorotheae]|uniref:S41 family peptidase n=1 Tax=Flexithrix dorotheae TaxID=70993 RepID=UPI0004760887
SPITQLENPYELIIPNPKVAVLLDNEVGSSGEAIAISFIGRDDTKSFGTATCGLSTANTAFKLSDNSTLYLATAFMADRNLNLFGNQIIPDEEANAQNILQKAVEWIEK